MISETPLQIIEEMIRVFPDEWARDNRQEARSILAALQRGGWAVVATPYVDDEFDSETDTPDDYEGDKYGSQGAGA